MAEQKGPLQPPPEAEKGQDRCEGLAGGRDQETLWLKRYKLQKLEKKQRRRI